MADQELENIQTQVEQIITNPQLTYHQKKHQLAQYAESLLDYPAIREEANKAMKDGVICDLFEGHAPYRPRYILPDYKKAIDNGSEFLELSAPENLDEAINFLTILYSYVPSITGCPVYLGDLDQLLEPFCQKQSDEELKAKIKLFLTSIDRLLPDGFTHANLGPEETRVGKIILQAERELKQVVPNLTMKYHPETSSEDFLLEGIKTVFEVGKPHFANHNMMVNDLGEQYGVASCYNSLRQGGGAHTLVRLNLKKAAEKHYGDLDSFLSDTLENYVKLTLEVIEARAKYLVERSGFFQNDFLVTEGFVSLENFSSMLGIFGLNECVETLLCKNGGTGKYGYNANANELAYQITTIIEQIIDMNPVDYATGNNGKVMFHSQSGIDLDEDTTPGTRLEPGQEPELIQHIQTVVPHHNKFVAGISDIFHFDSTIKRNPEAVADIIKGAFQQGMREFTFNISDGEFVRITGYLVRRSDVEKYKTGKGHRYSTTPLGEGAISKKGVLDRKQRMIDYGG